MFVNKTILILEVFICFFGSNTASYELIQPRIIGGSYAVEGEAPHQVSLQYLSDVTNTWHHFCGGSIICDKWIVTAGHCIKQGPEIQPILTEKFRVRYSSLQWQTGGYVIYVEKAIRHEKYVEDTESANYDIALLRTNETMILGTKLSDKIKLACKGSDPIPGSTVVTTGFGLTQEGANSVSPYLKIVKTHVIDRSKCNANYRNFTTFGITKQMFCSGEPTGGKGSCQGDSGGPLVINGLLEGIDSWGWDLCDDANHPSVSTRVGDFVDWIKEKVGTDCYL